MTLPFIAALLPCCISPTLRLLTSNTFDGSRGSRTGLPERGARWSEVTAALAMQNPLRCVCEWLHAGEVPIPEVMFPGGSPHLVEPIYQNPTLSAPFNEQLSSVIIARCAAPGFIRKIELNKP